jgi:hypothetical protein
MNDKDVALKITVFAILFFYAVKESSVFELQYPEVLVELFGHPWWRILVVLLVPLAFQWSPLIGITTAVVVFFYFHDMYLLTSVSFS